MKARIKVLLLGVAASLVTVFASGCAAVDEPTGEAPARDADLGEAVEQADDAEPQQELTCTPLGGHCKTVTACCIGRCISGRCLKL